MAKSSATPNDDEGWVEKGQDNGDLVEWKAGVKMQGVYLDSHSIVLPISDQNPDIGDGSGGEAEMLIFENVEHGGARWSTWVTYQLRQVFEDIAPGTECRIECTGERKAKIGNVKVFSVKTRTPRPVQQVIDDF